MLTSACEATSGGVLIQMLGNYMIINNVCLVSLGTVPLTPWPKP